MSAPACRALARFERVNQRPESALEVLQGGSQRLAGRRTRGEAIVLLRDAREIEPWNPAVTLTLCRLLARTGDEAEALFVLDHLDQKTSGLDLRQARALAWRIEPSLRHSWRWMCAAWDVRQAGRGRPMRRDPVRS